MSSKQTLASALAKAQGAMSNVAKDKKNPHFKSSFASLAAVRDVVIPALSDQGIAVIQIPGNGPDGSVTVQTVLLYGDEKLDCGTVGASLDTRGKSAAQAVGSVVTYLRRYALSAIAGVAQEDDDGNYGGPPRNQRRQDPPRPQPAQRQQQAPPKPQQIPADACVVADLKARILPGKKETWADLDGSDKNREFLEKVAKGKHPKHELRNNVAMACAAARLIEIEEDDAAMRHAEDEDAKADPPVTDEPQF